jgi:hypothetical protein
MRRTLSILLTATLMALCATGAAQETTLSLQGKILWISGQTMALASVDRPAVTVDLSRVDVADYATLMSGDWVVVTGTVPLGSNRLIATSVQRLAQ